MEKNYKLIQCEKNPPGAVRPFQWCYRGLIEDPERLIQSIETRKDRGSCKWLLGVRIIDRKTKEIIFEKMYGEI